MVSAQHFILGTQYFKLGYPNALESSNDLKEAENCPFGGEYTLIVTRETSSVLTELFAFVVQLNTSYTPNDLLVYRCTLYVDLFLEPNITKYSRKNAAAEM